MKVAKNQSKTKKEKLRGCRFQMEINYIGHIKCEVLYSFPTAVVTNYHKLDGL